MPSLIGSLYVSLTADFGSFQRDFRTAEGVVDTSSARMRRSLGLTEKSVNSLSRSFSHGIKPGQLLAASRSFDTLQQRANLLRGAVFAVTAAFGGFGAALTTNVVSRYLDTFTQLQNQLRVVSRDSAELASNFEAVKNVADRSRASLGGVATLFSRIQKSQPGVDPSKTLRRVETITKALQLGGATTQEAQSAAIQFSQAIASNRLQGDELRSLLETPLGAELAKGLGVTIGQLRKMGSEGELTADKVLGALDKIAGGIDTKFAGSISTIDQAITQADNKLVAYAGSLDKAYGITRTITGAIGAFGNNLDTIIPLIGTVAAGIGTIYAGRLGGAAGNATIGALARGIQGEIRGRKEAAQAAREQYEAVARANAEAKKALGFAQGRAADPFTAAPKSAVKNYQRDLEAITKADGKHLALLEEKNRVFNELAATTQSVTKKELAAADAQYQQHVKVIDAIKRRDLAARDLKRSYGDLEAARNIPTLANNAQEKDTAVAKARALVDSAQAEQTNAVKNLQHEERKLGELQAGYIRENNASFAAAAKNRAALLIREQQLVADIADSERRRATLVTQAQGTRAQATQAGAAVSGPELIAATRAVNEHAAALERSGASLQEATRRTGLLRTGFGLLQQAGSSLIGFLGGPWGVAFTVATAALTIFGIRAQKSAAEVAEAQRLIDETLASVPAGTEEPADLRAANLQVEIDKKTETLKKFSDELARQREGLADAINGLIVSGDFTDLTAEQADNAARALPLMAEQFRNGALSVEQLRDQLEKLGFKPEVVGELTQGFDSVQAQVTRASTAVDILNKGLTALNGQKTNLTFQIPDTFGVFEKQSFNEGSNPIVAQLREQYALYGKGTEALRGQLAVTNEAQVAEFKKTELLQQALGVQSKVLSLVELQIRAQELLASGTAKTREEANALAIALAAAQGKFLDLRIDIPIAPFTDELLKVPPALDLVTKGYNDAEDARRRELLVIQESATIERDAAAERARSAGIVSQLIEDRTRLEYQNHSALNISVSKARELALEWARTQGFILDAGEAVRQFALDSSAIAGVPPELDDREIKKRAARTAAGYQQYTRTRIEGNELEEKRHRDNRISQADAEGEKQVNTQDRIQQRADQLLERRQALTRKEAVRLATEELNAAERKRINDQNSKENKKTVDEGEKFQNKIDELREQASGAYLGDIDRQVLEQAKSLKNGSEMMAQYIAALNSGDLSQAPDQLIQIRNALMEIGAANTWRAILQQYGSGAQLAGQFADKQAELNMLVGNGRITAEQAGMAWADFLGQFQEYKWIDQTADAFSTFAESAITDFENIGDAFKKLLQDIAKMLLQEFVLNPLRDSIRSALAGVFNPGGSAPTSGKSFIGSAASAAMSFAPGGGDAGMSNGAVAKAGNAFLDYVATREGTAGQPGGGYNTSLGYGAYTGGEKNLTGMTLDQIDALQTQMLRNPANHFNSSALGRYQIVRTTLRSQRDKLGLSGNQLFDQNLQDRIGMSLANGRGANARGLGQEWASLAGRPSGEVLGKFNEGMNRAVPQLDKLAAGGAQAAQATSTAAQGLTSFGGGLNQFGSALSQFPAAPGGGGGVASIFGKLLGWGTEAFGKALSPAAWGVVSSGSWTGLYADGGYTGPGGTYEPAGTVHKGEVVWSKRDIARAGGVAVVEGMRKGLRGYSMGGIVGDSRSGVSNMRRQGMNDNGGGLSITYAPSYGPVTGSGPEIDKLRSDMRRDRETFRGRVLQTVQEGQRRGALKRR